MPASRPAQLLAGMITTDSQTLAGWYGNCGRQHSAMEPGDSIAVQQPSFRRRRIEPLFQPQTLPWPAGQRSWPARMIRVASQRRSSRPDGRLRIRGSDPLHDLSSYVDYSGRPKEAESQEGLHSQREHAATRQWSCRPWRDELATSAPGHASPDRKQSLPLTNLDPCGPSKP